MLRHVSKGVKRFWAALALLSLEMGTILLVFFLSLAAFVFITRRIFFLQNEEMDTRAFSFMAPYINDSNTAIVNFITFFGSHEFLIPANLLLIAYYVIRKHRWYSIKVPAIAVSSFVLMFGLKRFFGRQRPSDQLLEQATNFSFPSGHALMSITFYGLLAYIGWHSIKNNTVKWITIILLVLWILAIGASRIYLRKHYYSDVIAGLALGFLWLVVSLFVIRFLEKKSRQKLDPVVEQAPEPTTVPPNA